MKSLTGLSSRHHAVPNADDKKSQTRQIPPLPYFVIQCCDVLPRNSFHVAFVSAGTFVSASKSQDTVVSELITTDTTTSRNKQVTQLECQSATL